MITNANFYISRVLFWLITPLTCLFFFNCQNEQKNLMYWESRMEEQAFRNGEFDLKSAKDVILKSSVHHESYNILNNKKGPLSACLVVSLHLDERVLKEDKINLYNWCVENQKSLGFDIEALGSKSQAALDP